MKISLKSALHASAFGLWLILMLSLLFRKDMPVDVKNTVNPAFLEIKNVRQHDAVGNCKLLEKPDFIDSGCDYLTNSSNQEVFDFYKVQLEGSGWIFKESRHTGFPTTSHWYCRNGISMELRMPDAISARSGSYSMHARGENPDSIIPFVKPRTECPQENG